MLLYCFSLLNADWACGWQGPPIADEKSDEDQDYIMPDDEPESEDGSFDSDEHVSVSQHFAAAGSNDPASGNQSLFADTKSPADDVGAKRKRTTHGTEDLHRDFRPDEDCSDIWELKRRNRSSSSLQLPSAGYGRSAGPVRSPHGPGVLRGEMVSGARRARKNAADERQKITKQ